MSNIFHFKSTYALLFLFLAGILFLFRDSKQQETRQVTFFVQYESGEPMEYSGVENTPLEEALQKAGYEGISEMETVPNKSSPLFSGTIITLKPTLQLRIEDEKEMREIRLAVSHTKEALEDVGIELVGADFVEPSLETALSNGESIKVTRVTVTEESEETKIPFKKREENDDSLSWKTRVISQKGEIGTLTTLYTVSRHNGKIVAKEKKEESISKKAIDEITLIGTKVTVIKSHTGAASWYAHTGTLSAANPWLPIGSYVRVTNKANGKNVIVQINDRGPFGAGRIIDLDRVAFEKIADLGSGVVNVLMEEIK